MLKSYPRFRRLAWSKLTSKNICTAGGNGHGFPRLPHRRLPTCVHSLPAARLTTTAPHAANCRRCGSTLDGLQSRREMHSPPAILLCNPALLPQWPRASEQIPHIRAPTTQIIFYNLPPLFFLLQNVLLAQFCAFLHVKVVWCL